VRIGRALARRGRSRQGRRRERNQRRRRHDGERGELGWRGHDGARGELGRRGHDGARGELGRRGRDRRNHRQRGRGGGCTCPLIYAPVCGADGKTYASACEAQCANVTVAHTGECATTTLKIEVPTNGSFCDQVAACNVPPAHITILDGNGKALTLTRPSCTVLCGTACEAAICPLKSALCTAPHGAAFTGTELDWDGTYFTMSTCGQSTSCYAPHVAAAGHYVAHMCATPGTLSPPDGGWNATCTASGTELCIDVPFEYPATAPVIGRVGAVR
jgi:ribosomal protein S8E